MINVVCGAYNANSNSQCFQGKTIGRVRAGFILSQNRLRYKHSTHVVHYRPKACITVMQHF